MNIPYGRQTIEEDDINAVIEVLRSDYLTTGPKAKEFEEKVATYVGAKYAVAVSNGTAALHIACLAAGIGSTDEVITTPMTFAASANCALYCGAKPIFADICPDTYNIDAEEIKRKITKQTKAIIPVHYTGQPCNMKEIQKLAIQYNLIVIEDASHALGAVYQGKRIGSLSDMTIFSFHPVKNITTGEGGMVLTNNKQLYEKLRLFRSHGITREEHLLQNNEGGWYYEQLCLGYNYRITDIQCALGITQMDKLGSFLKKRRELVARYNRAFCENKMIVLPYEEKECVSAWHLYVIQIKEGKRDFVFQQLRCAGIGVNVHYIPVYHHPYYQNHGYHSLSCRHTEQLYKNIISLPLYPTLTLEEQQYIIEKVNEFTLNNG